MSKVLSQKDIDYLFRFVGYGDPRSRIWFVGIEEGGQTESPVTVAHRKIDSLRAYYDPSLPSGKNSVWRICSEIASACGQSNRYFLSNMGAIARKSERTRLYGIDEYAYSERVATERIPLLKELSERYQPRSSVIIFHGKGAWERYRVREIFGISTHDSGRIKTAVTFPERNTTVLLTNFLSRRFGCFTQDDQRELVAHMKSRLDCH